MYPCCFFSRLNSTYNKKPQKIANKESKTDFTISYHNEKMENYPYVSFHIIKLSLKDMIPIFKHLGTYQAICIVKLLSRYTPFTTLFLLFHYFIVCIFILFIFLSSKKRIDKFLRHSKTLT